MDWAGGRVSPEATSVCPNEWRAQDLRSEKPGRMKRSKSMFIRGKKDRKQKLKPGEKSEVTRHEIIGSGF